MDIISYLIGKNSDAGGDDTIHYHDSFSYIIKDANGNIINISKEE